MKSTPVRTLNLDEAHRLHQQPLLPEAALGMVVATDHFQQAIF